MVQIQLTRVLGAGASLLTFFALNLSRLSAAARVSAMEARPSSLQPVCRSSNDNKDCNPDRNPMLPWPLAPPSQHSTCFRWTAHVSQIPQQEHPEAICSSAHLSKLGVLCLSRSPAAAGSSAASPGSLPAAGAASAFLLPPFLALGSGSGQEPPAAEVDGCCLLLCRVTLAGVLDAGGATPSLAGCWLSPAQAGWGMGCAAAGCTRCCCCCSCQPATTLRGLCLMSLAFPFLWWPAAQQQDQRSCHLWARDFSPAADRGGRVSSNISCIYSTRCLDSTGQRARKCITLES